jgi:probable rRNA maturation factor
VITDKSEQPGSIDIADESTADWIDHERVRALIAFVIDRMRLDPECSVSVAIVDEDRMADLHVRWMDEPGPTDVLSFPMDDLRPGSESGPAPLGILGDIVVCPAVAQRQAETVGHAREQELDVLLTHGMLHLLGFDHAEPEEHRVMFGLQGDLLTQWSASERNSKRGGRDDVE